MLFVPTAAVGDRCRDVARADRSCGRSHSVRCPRPSARCRAPAGRWLVVPGTLLGAGAVVGELTRHVAHVVKRVPCSVTRLPVVLGTLLDAPRLWEVALVTLPTPSGALPAHSVLLPHRPRHASRVVDAVTRARLARFILVY
jgi:hypothetical protein